MSDFTKTELGLFNRYTNTLQQLAMRQGIEVEAVLPSHTCTRCARACPAGIPSPFRDTTYDICPVCVEQTEIVRFPPHEGALDREMNKGAGTAEEERGRAFEAIKRAMQRAAARGGQAR